MKVNGLILAAGLSSRMGEFKPLMPVGDKTLIESSVQSMLNGGVACVTVVLGHRGAEVEKVLANAFSQNQLHTVYNSQYKTTDMLQSVKTGIQAMPVCDAFFLLPGDMPAVSSNTFFAVQAAMRKTGAKLAFPTVEGWRKHPPLISAQCAVSILQFGGQGGLREVWKQYEGEMAEVAVEDAGCLLDTDTQDDYQKLLCYMQQKQQIRYPVIQPVYKAI